MTPLNYVLRILHKHLRNERSWLRMEGLAQADQKYAEGARMAKERVPQLEKAIEIVLRSMEPPAPAPRPRNKPTTESNNQLNLF